MSRKTIEHEFSDSDHIKSCEVASMNNDGKPCYVDFRLKFGYQHFNLQLTSSDIMALVAALKLGE